MYLHDHGRIFHDTTTWSKLLDGGGCVQRPGPSVREEIEQNNQYAIEYSQLSPIYCLDGFNLLASEGIVNVLLLISVPRSLSGQGAAVFGGLAAVVELLEQVQDLGLADCELLHPERSKFVPQLLKSN